MNISLFKLRFRPFSSKKSRITTANRFNVGEVLKVGEKVKESKRGFLIHQFSIKELRQIVRSKKSRVYIAKSSTGVNAYLVGHFGKKWLDSPQIKKTLKIYSNKGKEIISGEYAYLQHVAVAGDAHARKAFELEKRFAKDAKEKGFKFVLGEVALNPLNKTSFDFHLKFGGELIASYVDPITKVTWGVISREI
jgi:predicted GNAT superfamily acetyltransferase